MKEQCILMSTGQTAFFRDGEQVPELQKSWLKMYVSFLESCGVDPEKIDFTLPGGFTANMIPTAFGWTWELSRMGQHLGVSSG